MARTIPLTYIFAAREFYKVGCADIVFIQSIKWLEETVNFKQYVETLHVRF